MQDSPTKTPRSHLPQFFGCLFFFSGFASLVYQVVWMRQLSLFFGSDVYSAALTLSCFMGGLSLGSLLAARAVERLQYPLFWYGVMEAAIGIYAFYFTRILNLFLSWDQSIYQSSFEASPWIYHGLRTVIAACVLLVPTSLMGATLPLVIRRFVKSGSELGRYAGVFYSVNTLGALVGVLTVGFWLLPQFGVRETTFTALVINLLVGLFAVLVGSKLSVPVSSLSIAQPAHAKSVSGAGRRRTILLAIFISGLAALAFEVVWTRILIQSFSSTVYSFAIMLSCFLLGIAWGSHTVSGLVDGVKQPVSVLGFVEIGIGLCIAILGICTYIIPPIFGKLVWALTSSGHSFGFASTCASFVVSGALVAVPTFLLGATFPFAVKCYAADPRLSSQDTGEIYSANTAGGILGALIAGFLLIPAFGTSGTLVVIALMFAINGIVLVYSDAHVKNRVSYQRAAQGLSFIAVMAMAGTLLLPRKIIINFDQQSKSTPTSVYSKEGIAHTVDIVRNASEDTIMMVDGNIEADTSYLQRRHFILKAHLPLLLHPHPKDVAVVGLGLGITLASTARHPGIEKVSVIELNRGMLEAHQYLESVTGGVLKDPKVSVRIDDGRNFFAMASPDRKFDMITADPIHPRISGVGYLYTKEYYESVKRRLNPGGVVCQWMPMYFISKKSFDVAFRTFASVFPNASFWYVRGHGLFVATDTPFSIDYPALKQRVANAIVLKDLESVNIHSAPELLSHMMMGPAEIKTYLLSQSDNTVNTDDNAYLEYRTPEEFLEPTETIIRGLLPYAKFDPSRLKQASPQDRVEVMTAWTRRNGEVLPEIQSIPEVKSSRKLSAND